MVTLYARDSAAPDEEPEGIQTAENFEVKAELKYMSAHYKAESTEDERSEAFFTGNALAQISSITLNNASEFEASGSCTNAVQDSPASVVTAEVVASEV